MTNKNYDERIANTRAEKKMVKEASDYAHYVKMNHRRPEVRIRYIGSKSYKLMVNADVRVLIVELPFPIKINRCVEEIEPLVKRVIENQIFI